MGLGARLAIVFAAVAAATALLVGGASYVTTDRQVLADVDEFLQLRAEQIDDGQRLRPQSRRENDGNGNGNNNGNGRGRRFVSVSPDAEVQVLAGDGEITGNTDLELPVDDIDVRLISKNDKSVLRTVTIEDNEYRMITRHLEGVGAVQVARSLEESAGLLADLRQRLVIVSLAVALLAAAVGWMLAQRTTGPLRALTMAVDDVADTQDFTIPVPTSGSDEVGRLGRGFNRMLGTLQQSQEQQRRLVQDAAHELRTPLTSVTANLDWLERAPDIDAETRAATLGSVRRELGELNNVITEIIQLATDSRAGAVMAPIDLVPLVADAVELFIDRTGRDVSVAAASATAIADADGVVRAVNNLLSNADKYSPVDSPIAVVVGPDGVFVDDAGPGIPVDEREAIFDRFYRRDEDRAMPGSGLGLSIVASIVDKHGGQLHVSESPLGGARVGFTLPTR